MKQIVLISLILYLVACHPVEDVPGQVTACAPMQEARTAAAATVYGDSAFVFFGRANINGIDTINTSTFYCYHADRDCWTGPYKSPLSPREQACAITLNGKIYVGLGFDGKIYADTAYLHDWWCFDPETRQWDSLANYPTQHTVGAVPFVQDGLIYCCYGSGPGHTSIIERYNPQTNTWDKTISGSTRPMMACAGAMLDGKVYFGSGYGCGDKDNWYRLDLRGSSSRLKAVPGERSTAVAVAGSDCIYLIGGRHIAGSVTGGCVYSEILRYHPGKNRWDRLGYLPQGTNNAIAFRIGGHSYVGLGETFDLKLLNTLYRIDE